MRKIILSCLLLGISLTTYAQTSLFDLWQEASEHVNIYTYGLKPVKKDPCFRPDWKQKRGTKLEISSPTIIIGEFKCTVFPIQMYKKV